VRTGSPTGQVLGSVQVPVTGGWRTWTTVTANITDPGDSFELFLVARNTSSTADLFNVDWMEFVPQIEAAALSVPMPMTTGRAATADVTVANRTTNAVNATVSLSVPPGWTTTPVTAPVGAGATTTVAVPLTPPSGAVMPGRVVEHDISARISVPGQHAGGVPHARTYLVPDARDVVLALDAGSATSPVIPGYQRLEPVTPYSATTRFGWSANTGLQSRDRGTPDDLRRDMVTSQQSATLRLRVPPGKHAVSIMRGDPQFAAQKLIVTVNGVQVLNGGISLTTGQWGWDQFTVDGGNVGRTVDLVFSIDVTQFWRVNALTLRRLA
jgi:cytochrome c